MLKCKKSISYAEMIEKKLSGGHEIRPFPTAVNRLLSAIKNPRANAKTFEEIIELDAALSSRVLRMVNSSMYGFSNKVHLIRQAVTMLGLNPLKNLALTYAGMMIISGKSATKKEGEALWDHSLGCATTARTLANSVAPDCADDAFLAGIFHDIGKLFFLDVIPAEYSKLVSSTSGADLLEQETNLCGTTHVEVGLRLTVTWPLPDKIKGAVRYHHEPEADSSDNQLTALIHVADGLARSGGIGSPANQEICIFEAAHNYFGLSEEALASIQENAISAYETTKQAVSD